RVTTFGTEIEPHYRAISEHSADTETFRHDRRERHADLRVVTSIAVSRRDDGWYSGLSQRPNLRGNLLPDASFGCRHIINAQVVALVSDRETDDACSSRAAFGEQPGQCSMYESQIVTLLTDNNLQRQNHRTGSDDDGSNWFVSSDDA